MMAAMARMRMRDGAKLHYLDVGRGDPVVLLHGFAMHGAMWLPFVMRYAHRYRFILPDLRGFGRSHALPLVQPVLLDQHADDLADLVTGLGLGRFTLGGLSMGACTSLQYQQRHGFDRVGAYLHIDQAPCVRNLPDWRWGLLGDEQEVRLAPWADLMEKVAPWRGRSFGAIPRELRRRFWAAMAEFYGSGFHRAGWRHGLRLTRHERIARLAAPTANWPVYMDCLHAYLTHEYDWRESMRDIAVPMTAMVGMESELYPAEGQLRINDFVPHAEIVRFERCGHAVPFDAPVRFTRALGTFLEATRAPRHADAPVSARQRRAA